MIKESCPNCKRTDYKKVHKNHFCSTKCRKEYEEQRKMINIKEYPIIKEYEIFPSGSYYIELVKGVETNSELEQFLKFADLVYDEAEKKEKEK